MFEIRTQNVKNIQKLKIQATWMNFNMNTFLLFNFIYLFNFKPGCH